MLNVRSFVTAAACTLVLSAQAQTKWDLPAAYPATNFHSVNLQQFVDDIDKATAGKLKITLHPNASLFKANEIKRAVQTGQTQAGAHQLGGRDVCGAVHAQRLFHSRGA